jgi:hypothetical protein
MVDAGWLFEISVELNFMLYYDIDLGRLHLFLVLFSYYCYY